VEKKYSGEDIIGMLTDLDNNIMSDRARQITDNQQNFIAIITDQNDFNKYNKEDEAENLVIMKEYAYLIQLVLVDVMVKLVKEHFMQILVFSFIMINSAYYFCF
jgi:hypothetical protein